MADYGTRPGGGKKGAGYFGELPMYDGSVATEMTIGVDFGDGEEDIPLLVPTLKKSHIAHILSGKKPTKDIVDIAVDFARARKKAGLPYYAAPEEAGLYKVPDE